MFVGKRGQEMDLPKSNALPGKQTSGALGKQTAQYKSRGLGSLQALFCIKLSMSVCPDLAFSPLPSHVRVMLQVSMKSIDWKRNSFDTKKAYFETDQKMGVYVGFICAFLCLFSSFIELWTISFVALCQEIKKTLKATIQSCYLKIGCEVFNSH